MPKGTMLHTYHIDPVKNPVYPLWSSTGSVLLQGNYYASGLGFFCRQELRIQKATRVPFKFRLGSIQYCDWMEGKPNSVAYSQ